MTGRLPFIGPNSMDILLAHATEPPPTFREIGLKGWVPREVEELVFDCLAKMPEDRPQSARELAERFDTAMDRARTKVDSDPVMPGLSGERPSSGSRIGLMDTPSGGTAVKAAPSLTRDAGTLPFHMEAWMPESIALVKLRGFVHDAGGEVLESKGSLVRVRLGGRKGSSGTGALAWFGLRRASTIDFDLHLTNEDPRQPNQLAVNLVFRPSHISQLADKAWQQRCTEIFMEIRSYLMGRSD
jgi:serine/threonine protein kinase